MYHAQAQLHSCNQFHKRNATHDSEGKDKAYHIFRSSYSLRNKSFKASLAYLPAVIGVHWYMLSILLSNQNVFMFNVSGSVRAIRDPIKPELWDLVFALQSSPNCPKTAGNTVCCTEVFKALQIVEIHIWRTKHKSSQKLTVPTYMRAGLETTQTTQNTQNTQNTNTKYFIL